MAGIGCHELMKPYDMTLLPRRLIIYYINQWGFRPFSLDNLVSRLNFNFRLLIFHVKNSSITHINMIVWV